MDVQTLISGISLLGVGGIVGGYLQYIWNQKTRTESRIQNLNEDKYRSILVLMRCVLEPQSMPHFTFTNPPIQKLKSHDAIRHYAIEDIKEKYYNGILYASDDVLMKMKQFIIKPSEVAFVETAMAMRKDLWKRGTKISLKSILMR